LSWGIKSKSKIGIKEQQKKQKESEGEKQTKKHWKEKGNQVKSE